MYTPVPDERLKSLVDAHQLYESYLSALREMERNASKLAWERRGSSEYLISSRHLHGKLIKKSLGKRSEHTEAVYEIRIQRRAEAIERLEGLALAYQRQIRINRALKLGDAPSIMVRVLQEIERAGLSKALRVVGTNALYAYASQASVQFADTVVATNDVDLLWDSRTRLQIASPDHKGLAGVIQRADRSFGRMDDQIYTLVNKDGYQVDLIKRDEGQQRPEPAQLWENEEDFWAVKVRNMDWLLSSPRFSSVVIAANGEMAKLETVDPRAFVLFKYWLSDRPDRDRMKARRDLLQAEVVQSLVEQWLPHLPFQGLAAFPQSVRDRSERGPGA